MRSLIKYFKLIQYGLQVRMMIAFTFIFLGLGILFEVSGVFNDSNMGLSGLYMGLAGMYLYQLVITTAVSKFIKASPMKYEILTKAPVLVTIFPLMITFTIFALLRIFYSVRVRGAQLGPDGVALAYIGILQAAVVAFLMFIYLGFCYKNFILSLVLTMIILLPLVFGAQLPVVTRFEIDMFRKMSDAFSEGGALAVIMILSYILLGIGALGCYLVNKLTYRMELSELAYRNAMRQAAKS
ncbi:MAG: hypothetical protein IKS11_10415 [Lachnospiraceae bacterium]|nr:hypothetical protein [Lachnospiraceae bacterium]